MLGLLVSCIYKMPLYQMIIQNVLNELMNKNIEHFIG